MSKEQVGPFNPRDRAYRRKLWVRIATRDRVFHHIFWRRIALVTATLALMAWLGLAGAAWAFVKYRRGYIDVRYLDLALIPWRAAHYRTGLGRHYIAQGRAKLTQGDRRSALELLRAGLARAPADLSAWRIVAQIEVRFGRSDRAVNTLMDGLPFGRTDLDYLKQLTSLLLETCADDRLIALAGELLPPQPDGARVNQFIALQAATAHYHRGRTAQTARLITEWKVDRMLEGQILLARSDGSEGHLRIALDRLEAQVPQFPRSDELYVEIIRLHRKLGNTAEARRYALLRQFNDPTSPGPRIDLLHTYRLSGDSEAEQRELAAYFAVFGRDAKALLLLQWFAFDTAQPALANRVHDLAREQGFPLHWSHVARVQASLAARHYAPALAFAEEALRGNNTGHDYIASLLNAQRAIALFGIGDAAGGRVMLNEFLQNARVRSSDALLLARQLQQAGAVPQARRVLERACQLAPEDLSALAGLIRLAADAGDRAVLAEHLPRLLGMRKPSRDVLEETLRKLDQPADAALREQITAVLARRRD